MPLSDAKVRNARPSERPRKMHDFDALYLFIPPRGRKRWRLDYSLRKTRRTLSLGTYPAISLAEARRLRDEARVLLAQGIDPSKEKRRLRDEERRARIEAEAAAQSNSLRVIGDKWLRKREKEGIAPIIASFGAEATIAVNGR